MIKKLSEEPAADGMEGVFVYSIRYKTPVRWHREMACK